ncbi:MAG: hypothetical protein RLZZ21_83, partial [Planctomycetota bacterium]
MAVMERRILGLSALAIAIPIATFAVRDFVPPLRPQPAVSSGGTRYSPSPVPFRFSPLGGPVVGLPLITNVQIVDFTGDGQNDVLAADALGNQILLLQRQPDDSWRESVLIPDVMAPAHLTVIDIDDDGDLDILVAILGNIMPDDGVIGRVELFENRDGEFRRHVVLDDVRRVADVQ